MAEVRDIDTGKVPGGSDSQEPLIEQHSVDGATISSGVTIRDANRDELGKLKNMKLSRPLNSAILCRFF